MTASRRSLPGVGPAHLDFQPGGLLPSAAEVVLSHENLVQLIRDEHLIERWERSRGPILQFWDRLRMRRTDPAARERDMVRSLEKRLTVQVKGSQVTLGFDWPEAETAVRVVHRIEHNLLDSRRDAELLPLEQRVTSLESGVGAAQQRVDALAERIASAIKLKRRGARARGRRRDHAEGGRGAGGCAAQASFGAQRGARRTTGDPRAG